jgi:hypothetical protein
LQWPLGKGEFSFSGLREEGSLHLLVKRTARERKDTFTILITSLAYVKTTEKGFKK